MTATIVKPVVVFLLLQACSFDQRLFNDRCGEIVDGFRNAHLVFVGEVLEVGPAPGFESGIFMATQNVRYRIVECWRGCSDISTISLRHQVTGRAAIGLDTKAFAVHNEFIVTAVKQRNVFLVVDPDVDAIPATPVNLKVAKSLFAAGD